MSVLVTVESSRTMLDVELDDALPVGKLLPELADAMRAAPDAILALPDGAPLDAGTTLAAAGVLDGQRLVLLDASRAAPADVLACYLAVDTSDSVTGPALDVLNVELARLADALRDDNRVSRSCRLAVLTFDVEARVVLPLTPAAELRAAPALAATRPGTDYTSVLRLLRRQIERDLTGLRMAGLRPLRPLVVLVTDGRPTRGHWPPAHAALTDPGWEGAPEILAFGVGHASALTLRRLGTAGTHLPDTSGPESADQAARRVRLVAPVLSFVLDVLGHPSASAGTPPPLSAGNMPDSWPSLDELIR